MSSDNHIHVLVVEDDIDLREAVVACLEDEGYTVAAAGNGAEALRKLNNGIKPAVILLDLMMPVMNGWQFHEKLQEDTMMSQIPVVVFSANEHLSELKATAYLAKPVSMAQLVRTIESCVRGN